ncbi:hypothetical protein ASPWEDRAFT_126763 [Aspergillus wentii DTO 134E9]|uniref:Endo-xylogalacturonan hydrolase A n=1 Tax=Aspergillus wentii DTO 134E9 TaxID=1073089 RepID=A0A1L9RU20_ASPWE|nr:uncharacterized protein ASPWEDRAFT_126763 [Aspergillus wentii DTO 134E9]KAI9934007.1 hypothetical protein MW887_005079 [Aspergillus wentii]OJJ38373.1 hypothetical protein ASPWEDRAFT_126763 [Aspergillus wentii DTO 134E9]
MSLKTIALLSTVALGYALPSTPVLVPRSACTPTAGGSASKDDIPAIKEAISSCGKGGTIVIPKDTTYYLNSVLEFDGCSGCDFQIEGLLKFASNTDYWEGKTAMIGVSDIDGLKIRSLTGEGVIDGNGQDAWDKFAKDSDYARPTLLYIDGGNNLEISNFHIQNPPNVFISVKGDAANIAFSNLNLSATSNSDNEPKNTDGFDIGASSYVTITNTTIVNDDDCVAFKPGSNYVTVRDVSCTGSHGISVGSMGKSNDDTIKNIYVQGATMINSTKAAGIKTYPTGNGHGLSTVSNVTFTDFTVQGCDYAIQIQSCYGEDEDYCEKNPGNSKLTGVLFEKFSGTTSDKNDPVTGNLNCGADGTCDVKVSDYTVKAPSGDGKVLCGNTPSDIGTSCSSGASG